MAGWSHISCSLMVVIGIHFKPWKWPLLSLRWSSKEKEKRNINVSLQMLAMSYPGWTNVIMKGNYWSWLQRSILWLDFDIECSCWMHRITRFNLPHLGLNIWVLQSHTNHNNIQQPWRNTYAKITSKWRRLEIACPAPLHIQSESQPPKPWHCRCLLIKSCK